MIVVLPLLIAVAAAGPSEGKSTASNSPPAVNEEAARAPLKACEALLYAAKNSDFDAAAPLVSRHTRETFNWATKWFFIALRSRFASMRCVRVTELNEDLEPGLAMIFIYAPQGRSHVVPFIHEDGGWRFDRQRYELVMANKDVHELHRIRVASDSSSESAGQGSRPMPSAAPAP